MKHNVHPFTVELGTRQHVTEALMRCRVVVFAMVKKIAKRAHTAQSVHLQYCTVSPIVITLAS